MARLFREGMLDEVLEKYRVQLIIDDGHLSTLGGREVFRGKIKALLSPSDEGKPIIVRER